MIKKTIFIILLAIMMFSCGKKDCPKNNLNDDCSRARTHNGKVKYLPKNKKDA